MENKKKTVEDFLQQGEKLMELPGSPKFLETHVNKLKEAWTVSWNVSKSSEKVAVRKTAIVQDIYFSPQAANEEALKRKNGLADNLEAWKNFEEKRMDGPLKLDLV